MSLDRRLKAEVCAWSCIIEYAKEIPRKDPIKTLDFLARIHFQATKLGSLFDAQSHSRSPPDFARFENTPKQRVYTDQKDVYRLVLNIEIVAKEIRRELSANNDPPNIDRVRYCIDLIESSVSDIVGSHYFISSQP